MGPKDLSCPSGSHFNHQFNPAFIPLILQFEDILTGLQTWIAIDVFQIKFELINAPVLSLFVE